MLQRKKTYFVKMTKIRRQQDNGKLGKLKPGVVSEDNVLYKGFPRYRKVARIMRFSRLTIMRIRGGGELH